MPLQLNGKNPVHSFMIGDLIDYFRKPNEGKVQVFHNLLNTKDPSKDLIQNTKYLQQSLGSKAFNEVISVKINPNIPIRTNEADLARLCQSYLNKKYKNHIAYGKAHIERDKGHLHIHLAISSSPIMSENRTVFSKEQHRYHQVQLELEQLEKYPNLGSERIYTRHLEKIQKARCLVEKSKGSKDQHESPEMYTDSIFGSLFGRVIDDGSKKVTDSIFKPLLTAGPKEHAAPPMHMDVTPDWRADLIEKEADKYIKEKEDEFRHEIDDLEFECQDLQCPDEPEQEQER